MQCALLLEEASTTTATTTGIPISHFYKPFFISMLRFNYLKLNNLFSASSKVVISHSYSSRCVFICSKVFLVNLLAFFMIPLSYNMFYFQQMHQLQ